MHAVVLGLPLRNAVVSTRISATGLAPFTIAAPSGCSLQFCRTKSYSTLPANLELSKRPTVVSISTSNKAGRSERWMSSTKLSCQHRQAVTVGRLTAAVTRRCNSTLASQTTVNQKATSPLHAAAGHGTPLDWNTFFQLRASRRRFSLVSSILTAFASTGIGIQVLSSQDLDAMGAQVMGLDPFIVLGLATAACGAIGWLAGPVLGNGLWGLINRRFRSSFAQVSITISLSFLLQIYMCILYG